ncbi:MAG: histidine ammonia-lyase [Anaerolineaceae bacterium]|nr:histidine ammonia-lyase [Anaerolineaceae bacterium]
MNTLEIDGNSLTIEDVARVARHLHPVHLSETGLETVRASSRKIKQILHSGKPAYGINTGFGIFADTTVSTEDSAKLSRNLILSHAVGTGTELSKEVTRGAMLVRANTLSKGFSGVRPEIIQLILDMLNLGVTPIVPSQGSMGSSGDLCPLSHLALVFTTDESDLECESGLAEFEGVVMPGKQAMARANLCRIILGAKEGLAINNGATFSAALCALVVYDAQYLQKIASLSAAMSTEALLGSSDAFDARIHEIRGQVGQITVAQEIRELISGSTLMNAANRVQDAYSLRCAPQVHGAILDTINYAYSIITREINAATDNPLVFSSGESLSGGNFHGEPVGFAADFLGISLAELGAISERRIYRLINGKMNEGLPPMLVDHCDAVGLNSGLMMPQYTAASLVLENQALAFPDSVHSLPTSGGQEDHNANSMVAARHARQIADNTLTILATELYTAARAIDLRLRANPGARLGVGTREAYEQIRQVVPYQAGDTLWGPEICRVREMLADHALMGVSIKS